MTERKIKHWQDPVNVVLGLWFVVSPWIVGYADRTPAMWSAVIAGLVLAAAAASTRPAITALHIAGVRSA